jgi:hypothetical protein
LDKAVDGLKAIVDSEMADFWLPIMLNNLKDQVPDLKVGVFVTLRAPNVINCIHDIGISHTCEN